MKWLSPSLILSILLFWACFFQCRPKVREEDRSKYVEGKHNKFFGKRLNEEDGDFIANAVAANYAEIKFARLAIAKSSNPLVKHIAALLEKDHSKVLTELICLAHKRGIVIPGEESHDAKIKILDLNHHDQSEFDKRWCMEMLDKHEITVRQFEYMWGQTGDIELKDWITSSLPELISHLEHLMEYQDNSSSPNLRMTASHGRAVFESGVE